MIASSGDRLPDGSLADHLLATKLLPPSTRSQLVFRPHLFELLDRGRPSHLTLIAAPAGFGKTTLLQDWLRRQEQAVAWLTLEADDSEPLRFWTYVFAALRNAYPALDVDHFTPPQAPHPDGLDAATALINGIAGYPEQIVLILDDYHLIDSPAVHDSMTFLFDHLPPQLHLMIATRAEPPLPLARLRARGQVVELRAADLRFTPKEAQALLHDALCLPLGAADIARLAERTQGWVAGLHLAALALRDHADPVQFVRTISGNQPIIAEYLLDEVLAHQPSHIQSFLLQTALVERMSVPLCSAITGRHDSQTLLIEIERSNLFIVPLDAEHRWYRYHPFFAEALRARIAQAQPDEALAVHRRGAAWYVANAMPAEAIAHLVAANDLEAAADLLAQLAESLWLRGEVGTLLRWLQALPEALIIARPALGIARTYALLGTGQSAADVADLQQESDAQTPPALAAAPPSASAIAAGGVDGQDANAAAMWLMVAVMQDAAPHTIDQLQQALDASVAAAPPLLPTHALNVGFAYCTLGLLAPARSAFTRALHASQRSGDRNGEILATTFLAELLVQEGQLRQAMRLYEQVALRLERLGESATAGAGLPVLGQAIIWYEWNELERAQLLVEQALALAQRSGRIDVVLNGQIAAAQITQAMGDAEGARTSMAQVVATARATQSPRLLAYAAGQQAALWLAQEDAAAVNRWALAQGMHIEDELSYFRELEYLTFAGSLGAEGWYDDALELLARLLARTISTGQLGRAIPILIAAAGVHQARGEAALAQAVLPEALELAEPGGYLRRFIEGGVALAALLGQLHERLRAERRANSRRLLPYLERILRAAQAHEQATASLHSSPVPESPVPVRQPGGIDPPSEQADARPAAPELTARELQILRCIAVGMPNDVIAQQLGLTPGTVKWYVAKIYAELEVHNRTQAVARGQALGILA